MVVANAVAALAEINAEPEMTPSSVNKLLTALNECTEWGQVRILAFVFESVRSLNSRILTAGHQIFSTLNENLIFLELSKPFS